MGICLMMRKGNIRGGHSLNFEDYEAFSEVERIRRHFFEGDYKNII